MSAADSSLIAASVRAEISHRCDRKMSTVLACLVISRTHRHNRIFRGIAAVVQSLNVRCETRSPLDIALSQMVVNAVDKERKETKVMTAWVLSGWTQKHDDKATCFELHRRTGAPWCFGF